MRGDLATRPARLIRIRLGDFGAGELGAVTKDKAGDDTVKGESGVQGGLRRDPSCGCGLEENVIGKGVAIGVEGVERGRSVGCGEGAISTGGALGVLTAVERTVLSVGEGVKGGE
jgi:hypothetical protein